MTDPVSWTVPGYTIGHLLGFGATGEVWLGTDDVTGEHVALKRLQPGAGGDDRERLRREASMLAAFEHPNVIRLRGVLRSGTSVVLVLDLATGGSLDRLLVDHGPLSTGQMVAVFAPLATALAAAHEAGLIHADVSPANILLQADDAVVRPLLADLGTARLVGENSAPAHGTAGFVDPAVLAGDSPSRSSDVYSLAASAANALTGSVIGSGPHGVQWWADGAHLRGADPAVVGVLVSALASEPSSRPSAAEFARKLAEACPAEDVSAELIPAKSDVDAAAPIDRAVTRSVPRPDQPSLPAPRRRPKTLVWVAGVVAAVVLAAVGGVVWAMMGSPEKSEVRPPVAVSTEDSSVLVSPKTAAEWSRALTVLDARRQRAFSTGDPTLLRQVYAPDSEPLAADTAALTALVAAGTRANDVRHEVRDLRIEAADGQRARLLVSDRMPSYQLIDAAGVTVRVVPAREERQFVVELLRHGKEWRIARIISADGVTAQ